MQAECREGRQSKQSRVNQEQLGNSQELEQRLGVEL